MFTDEDMAFFERQHRQAERAHQAIVSHRIDAGVKGEYIAFHDGAVIARGDAALHEPWAPLGLDRADVYVTYLPGRHDVLVY